MTTTLDGKVHTRYTYHMTTAHQITTVAHEPFTVADSEVLAALILKRFGWDTASAAAAWRRLLQNSCMDAEFEALAQGATAHVRYGRHLRRSRSYRPR
jgi:hypothetical protein